MRTHPKTSCILCTLQEFQLITTNSNFLTLLGQADVRSVFFLLINIFVTVAVVVHTCLDKELSGALMLSLKALLRMLRITAVQVILQGLKSCQSKQIH